MIRQTAVIGEPTATGKVWHLSMEVIQAFLPRKHYLEVNGSLLIQADSSHDSLALDILTS